MDWDPLMCRVCFATSHENIDLKNTKSFNSDINWLEIFNLCTCLKINPDDDLPKKLCQFCSADLLAAFEFNQKAQQADRLLKSQSLKQLDDNISMEPADYSSSIKQETKENDYIEKFDEKFSEEYDHCSNDYKLLTNDNTINIINVTHKSEDSYDIKFKTDSSYLQVDSNQSNEVETNSENFNNDDFKEDYLEEYESEQIKLDNCHDCYDTKIQFLNEKYSEDEENVENPPTGNAQLVCSICNTSFSLNSGLETHIRLMHRENYQKTNSREKIDCDLCGKQLRRWSLQYHKLRFHTGKRSYLCSACPKTFVTAADLKIHARTHDTARKREFQCTVCSKAFYEKQARDVHEKRHTGILPFQCKECKKRFFSRKALEVHYFVHNRELGKFQCNFCKKLFASNIDLTVHTRFHTGIYPFKCDFCDKSFAVKSHYNYHIAKHKGVVYKCHKCDKQFKNRGSLSTHLQAHNKKMIFNCSICNKEMSTQFALKRHMKIHRTDAK